MTSAPASWGRRASLLALTQHAWRMELPYALTALLSQAARAGQVAWGTVALHEIAYLGIIFYETYVHLTEEERAALGRLSPTAARKMVR